MKKQITLELEKILPRIPRKELERFRRNAINQYCKIVPEDPYKNIRWCNWQKLLKTITKEIKKKLHDDIIRRQRNHHL